MNTVSVNLPNHAYDIHIGSKLLAQAGGMVARLPLHRKIAIVADEAVAPKYAPVLMESLKASGFEPVLKTMPGGEKTKCLATVEPLLSWLANERIERTSALIALGGGVIGDLTGFLAGIYLRGIPFIQIPTTLLAMVDSSVGGKTGVDLPEGKNLVGVFHQPSLVLADMDTLQTLPEREIHAGMAEIIKTGIIADAALFNAVAKGNPTDLAPIIRRCVELKAQIVMEDERETSGRRALLNFGHTLGHAIENASGYGSLLHGEAVAIGMRAAAHLSHRVAGLSQSEVECIESVLAANHLPLRAPGLSWKKIGETMARDKKVQAGKNRWVLTPRIGQAILQKDIPADAIEASIRICLDDSPTGIKKSKRA